MAIFSSCEIRRVTGLILLCLGIISVTACSSTPGLSPATNISDRGATLASPTHAPTPAPTLKPNPGNEMSSGGASVTAQAPITSSPPAAVKFSLSSSNHTPPPDILREVTNFVPGGGGGGVGCDVPGNEQSTSWPQSVELMEDASIVSCGWQTNEQVVFTLVYPNGTSRTSTEQAKPYPYTNGLIVGVSVTLTPQLTDPLGNYSFQITGVKKSVQGSYKVVRPAGGRIKTIDGGTLLYGFSPEEHIRFFVLQREGTYPDERCTLAGWQEVIANPVGEIMIKHDLPRANYTYRAIGEISGEIREPFGCGTILAHITKPCPNAPDSRLSLGQVARVAYNLGTNVRIRSGAGANYDKVASLPAGTTMTVRKGPVCADNYVWWKVKIDNGTTGWVAEGEPDNYFIQPWEY